MIDSLKHVTWEDALKEGEKRIQQHFLDSIIQTNSHDRARLVAQRENVKRKIMHAIEENSTQKLRKAFRAQLQLLKKIQYPRR